ncbi:hypothetical protein QRX50_17455 [Amycolatopsis carbonis]|uniref:Uncharacterized protein n=1 Tax=Amycolatopsis carbonis TaxID=715471 RepID=A0A9Y2MXK8_9PSEU|nr:hypothetical protein [Amycolatopsis sp. 2-15]WIX82421.1 hypothetical protein QRX50_17455 [Amycolatopsis sp. 2-15]
MNFDSVADDLYAGEPADFVASRTAAARAAKKAGDAELASRIQALRKPTTAAFFVNRLARDGSSALEELAELGDRLRAAHASLAGEQLRELAQRRAELVRGVLRDAPDLSDSVAREVEETLETVVADPDVARLVLAGRLTSVAHQDADQWLSLPAGSGPRKKKAAPAPALASAPAPAPAKKSAKKPAPAKEKSRPEKSEEDRERERAAREEWQRKASAATRERAEASRTLVRTERIAEQADARVAELRERLAEAEERATRAAKDLSTARAAFDKADEAVREFTHNGTSTSRRR